MKAWTYFFILLFIGKSFVEGKTIEKKSLNRITDPIIIKGENLKIFLGCEIEKIGIYAAKDDKLQPIPFQIDEKNKKDEYVLTFNSKKMTDEDNGLLDENDEIVFRASDLGDKFSPSKESTDYKTSCEIEVIEPLSSSIIKEKGWAYIFYFNSKAERSSFDYVQYLPEQEKILTENYIAFFEESAPLSLHLILTEKGGGNAQDIFDKFKIRGSAKSFLGINFSKNENDFVSELIGYIDGPVRIIRRTKNKLLVFGVISSPYIWTESFFYPDFYIFPIDIYVPFDMSTYFLKVNLRLSAESSKTSGRKFYNSNNQTGIDIDGINSQEEKKIDKSPSRWDVVAGTIAGDTGGWLSRIILKKDSPLIPKLYYCDDINSLDPPENSPGQIGACGYLIENLHKLKQGTHKVISIMYSLPKYEIGEEKKYLNIMDNPLIIKVH